MEFSLDNETFSSLKKIAAHKGKKPSVLIEKVIVNFVRDFTYTTSDDRPLGSNRFSDAATTAKMNRAHFDSEIESLVLAKETRYSRVRRFLEHNVRPLLVSAEDAIEHLNTHVDLSGVIYRETFSGQGHLHLTLKTKCLVTQRLAKLKFIASPQTQRLGVRCNGRGGRLRLLRTNFDTENIEEKVEGAIRTFILDFV